MINCAKKSISASALSKIYLKTYLSRFSQSFISSCRLENAISGSIIRNSERCLVVLEFSALKVGQNVYTLLNAWANVSAFNCPLTVRDASFQKKSFE